MFSPLELPPQVCLLPRKPLSSGQPHRRVTHFPSLKNKTMVACESSLLAQFCLHLEYEPKVIAYVSRPFAVQFIEADLTVRPHFAAILADDRRVYYQVESADEITDPRRQYRQSLTKQCFGHAGFIFECIRPEHYQAAVSTETLRCLYHQAFGASAAQVPNIRRRLGEATDGRMMIRSLLARGIPLKDIAFALFFQHIHTDLRKPVDLNTIVEII
ncbi:hypothetical protein [Pseudomonas viridiflava]|nr:hypothetical protein [Pseudomonas viridiflava]